jgi:hypothetical protein
VSTCGRDKRLKLLLATISLMLLLTVAFWEMLPPEGRIIVRCPNPNLNHFEESCSWKEG